MRRRLQGVAKVAKTKNIDIVSNQDKEIRLFGSHTILVHSIAMFFIVTILIMMLAICIMNFLHYTPAYFQNHPFRFRSSTPSINADDIADNVAFPEEGDFTNVGDRPVK